jgi:peptidyl-prolyl cis-trans isomerase D
MIANFRKSLRSWATIGLLLFSLIAIVATGFGTGGFGGLGSLTKSSGASDGSDRLATVEGRAISADEIRGLVNKAFSRAHQQQPTLDMAAFLAQGTYDAVLEQTIVADALQAFADHQGLVISQTMIDREIANLPAFRTFTGQFDQNLYRQQLQQMGLTEAKLREDIAQSLTQRQLIGPIALGARAPEAIAREYANLLLERRQGLVAVVPNAMLAAGINPSDAEIAAFYRANRVAFTIPERRVIKYAVIGPEQVAQTPPPTDAEIAQVYRNSPRSFGARETRTLQSITFAGSGADVQARANAFAQRVRGGTNFVAAAQQAGFTAADVTFSNQTRDQFAGVTNPQVAAAAFAAAQGAVVGPTRSELGWHVVRVDHVTTVAARPLEAVRGEIAAWLNQRKRADALAALVGQAEEQLSSGASFEEVARAHNLTIVTTPPVTANGQPVGGPPWTAPPELAPLIHAAFDMDAEDSEPSIQTIAANERYAMLGLERVVPAAAAPLAEISQQVRQALIQQRARQMARALADRIVQRINSGTPAAQAFAEAQPRIQNSRPVNLTRLDISHQGQQTPPPLIALFQTPQGHARVVPADNNAGWFIVVHQQRTAGDASTNTALVQQMRTQFNSLVSEELAQQFAHAIELRSEISRDEDAIRRAREQMMGSARPPAG